MPNLYFVSPYQHPAYFVRPWAVHLVDTGTRIYYVSNSARLRWKARGVAVERL